MVRVTALALTALTGFSGLVYEVAWQKYVATLLGSHSEATAAVLALFLGGLSAGYALFGRVTKRAVERAAARGEQPRLLLLYGIVEAGIGLHALMFPAFFAGVRTLSLAIPHEVSGVGFGLDVVLVALLILPPTVLMGGTIPLLTQALSRSLADATRLHALVYAFNTTGAFAGALLAGFVLVPLLGLQRVVLAMGAVNLFAGFTFGLLGLLRRGALGLEEPDASVPVRLGVFAPVALLSGFAAMALQTVLIRLGGLSMGSSEFTFSMVVAIFVLCIAVGSFAVSALPRIPSWLLLGVQATLALILLLLYPFMADGPYWAHVVRASFRDESLSFYFYYGTLFLGILGILAVPVGLSGATLPLIFHQLRRELGGLGSAAGRLYSFNTVGSLLGALLGGYLLLFWLNLDQIYALAVGCVLTSAGLLAIRLLAWPRITSSILILILIPLAYLPRWEPHRLASGLFRSRKPTPETTQGPTAAFRTARPSNRVAFYTDDPASSVAVFEAIRGGDTVLDLAIVTNGKSDGAVKGDYPTMALAALLPALFAERVERAFVIGFGTGVTVGELAAMESVEKVVVAEISPGVIEAAALFDSRNLGALSSPKTEVIVSDAYRALQGSEANWDVIVSEPSNPWVAGVEMLFSREFLTAARDHLRPGGIYAQWFHRYEVNDDVVALVLRTYASVFDYVAVWFTLGTDIILLGFDDPARALDIDEVERRALQPDLAAGLRRARIDSFQELLAHEILPLGVLHAAELEGDVHTLLHPVLNHRASRAFFAGGEAALPPSIRSEARKIGDRNSLMARYRRRQGGRLTDTDYDRIAGETCVSRPILCPSILSRWAHDQPGSPELERFVTDLRAKHPSSNSLEPELLDALAGLHDRETLPTGRLFLPEVLRLTSLYSKYYHHGVAFDPDVLADVWSRCKDRKQGLACSEARARREQELGPLTRPRRARSSEHAVDSEAGLSP